MPVPENSGPSKLTEEQTVGEDTKPTHSTRKMSLGSTVLKKKIHPEAVRKKGLVHQRRWNGGYAAQQSESAASFTPHHTSASSLEGLKI